MRQAKISEPDRLTLAKRKCWDQIRELRAQIEILEIKLANLDELDDATKIFDENSCHTLDVMNNWERDAS